LKPGITLASAANGHLTMPYAFFMIALLLFGLLSTCFF